MNQGQHFGMEGRIVRNFQSVKPAIPDSIIRWRLETQDVVDDLRKDLAQLGNEKLVMRATSLFKGCVNKGTIQGHTKSDLVDALVLRIADDETEHVGAFYHEYEMDAKNRDMYIDILINYIYLGLSRSIDDLERIHTVEQSQEKVHTTQGMQSYFPFQNQPPQQQGLL